MKHVLLMIAVVVVAGCDGAKEEVMPRISDPSNPQNVIVEKAIRKQLKKPEG